MEQQEKGLNDPRQEEQREKKPAQPQRKCPRCDSDDTKFCYYNNYSMSQPRYFCKACRRYWTQGGILRDIPVGSSSRKGKRPKKTSPSSSSPSFSKSSSPSLRAKRGHSGADAVIHVQEGTDLLGCYGSSATGGNHLSMFPTSDHQPLNHTSNLVMTLPSSQSFNPMVALDPSNTCLYQDYIGSSLNPSSHVHNNARQCHHKRTADNLTHQPREMASSDAPIIVQEQTRWDQSFIDDMTLINNTAGPAGTSGGNSDGNMNNFLVRSPYVDQDQWIGHQNFPGYGLRP